MERPSFRMDEFSALINSFGEQLVTAIGKGNLAQLTVRGHEGSGSADVEILLSDNSWDQQIRAIQAVADVRTMFIDELSFSYQFFETFEDEDVQAPDAKPAYTLV